MKNQRGFILIELIAAIVLTGVIASFATFFLYTGFNGYQKSKNTSEAALNAQMALDRITLELRNLSYFTSAPDEIPPDLSMSYKSEEFTGTRTLSYDSNSNNIILNVNGNNYPLLNEVSSFSLSFASLNLDNATAPQEFEVSRIDVGFKLNGIGREFSVGIFPRNLVPKTW
jgi:prepilin-type N-terminal cleavage/methylation domain-containing protein